MNYGDVGSSAAALNSPRLRHLRVAVDFPWDASACMGTGAYSETMVRALAKAAPTFQITLLVTPGAPRNVHLHNVAYRELPNVDAIREGQRQVALPSVLSEMKADCLFAPATLLPMVKVCPMMTTVHDLSFVRSPSYYAPALVEHLDRWFDPSLEAADHVVAISEETRRDLIELKSVPATKIEVIPQPVRETFDHPLVAEEVAARLRTLGIEKPYFFHVSNLGPHKNVSFALEVCAQFLRKHPESRHFFVFAGGGRAPNEPPDPLSLAKSLGIGDRVQYAGMVDDEALKALYQGCEAFLFPSLAEGWGLPVAEATALGVRVLASPGTPAASMSQRFKLETQEWVKALESPPPETVERRAISFDESGKALADAIVRVATRNRTLGTVVPRTTRSRRSTGISGCTIVRNAVQLGYPLEASIESYAPICDEIVLAWDPRSEDSTRELVQRLARRFSNIKLVESPWNLENREAGTEIARQTQIAFSHCTCPWTLYVQADEAVHEAGHEEIVELVRGDGHAGASFERRSFLGTLDQEIPEMRSAAIVRLFRTGHGRSVGDAMHVAVEGDVGSIRKTAIRLFNYSRMGTDEEIRQRSDNLNRFYHDDKFIANLDPDRNKRWKTVVYSEPHPGPIQRIHRTPQPMERMTRRPIRLVISVDDIRPKSGRGLELETGPLALLRDLNAEFGCRFTLFMPTNFYGRCDLRDHRDWFKALLGMGFFEIASHGHHHWNLAEGRGDMEYMVETRQEADGLIARSLEVFTSLGHRPVGAKAPGWGLTPAAVAGLTGKFEYLADHFLGTDWDWATMRGLPRLPYTRCIHEPLSDLLSSEGPLLVLHSHISKEGGRDDNGWEKDTYENVRAFLRKLMDQRGESLSFSTAAEALAIASEKVGSRVQEKGTLTLS